MFMSELNILAAQQRYAWRRDVPIEGRYNEDTYDGGHSPGQRPERANIVGPEHEDWRRKMGITYDRPKSI